MSRKKSTGLEYHVELNPEGFRPIGIFRQRFRITLTDGLEKQRLSGDVTVVLPTVISVPISA